MASYKAISAKYLTFSDSEIMTALVNKELEEVAYDV